MKKKKKKIIEELRATKTMATATHILQLFTSIAVALLVYSDHGDDLSNVYKSTDTFDPFV
jgi:hypothetical protein